MTKKSFKTKKQTEKVRGILGRYLDGSEIEFRTCAKEIVALIREEYMRKETFHIQLQDLKDAGY